MILCILWGSHAIPQYSESPVPGGALPQPGGVKCMYVCYKRTLSRWIVSTYTAKLLLIRSSVFIHCLDRSTNVLFKA